MEYKLILAFLLLAGIVTFGIYMTVNSIAEKIFEKQKWDIRAKNSDITLPLRLQAYERMCLFLERITPNNLMLRVVPVATSALELQQIVLQEIREEFNHNVAQQIYISTPAWEQISNAMNETVVLINQAASEVPAEAPPAELARKVFSQVISQETQPVAHALKVLKEEVRTIF